MNRIARWWRGVQGVLFRGVEAGLEEPLTDKQRELVSILEVVRIEEHVEMRRRRLTGRPAADRRAMARAFVAKAVYNDPTTVALLERLRAERNLCRICGWDHPGEVPSEATFSRAFGEFAASGLGDRVHGALVERHVKPLLVGHVARDSTEIEARERAAKKPKKPPRRRKRGRPRKGEVVERRETPSRLPRQLGQTADEALRELPRVCDWGAKRDSGGHKHAWKGYKLHLDVGDPGLPLNAQTTSASLHDSQIAIAMARQTAERVTALYELMDSAYAAPEIEQVVRELGHVPIIDLHAWRKQRGETFDPATAQRYQERMVVERAYSRLKDHFGARFVRVRGHPKVHLHLMFGVITLFADQLLKLAAG
jgi:hypothetical protein